VLGLRGDQKKFEDDLQRVAFDSFKNNIKENLLVNRLSKPVMNIMSKNFEELVSYAKKERVLETIA
jgi:hypothetical protein